MKKILSVLVCLFICTAVLAGCGTQKVEEETTVIENDAAVVGTWMESDFDSGYVFNSDLTGKNIYWDAPFTYTAYDGLITITYDGDKYGVEKISYTVTDSTISMTRQSADNKTFVYSKR